MTLPVNPKARAVCRPSLLAAWALCASAGFSPGVHAQGSEAPVAMSPAWAATMCEAWNAEPVLREKLVESGWAKNDEGRGYKAMQIYRGDCSGSAPVELRIAVRDGQARSVHGGAPQAGKLNDSADYLMWAESGRWREMGAGDYGPMKAMMFGRLNFEGPRMEAMGNMGPFEKFLLLVGKVPGDWGRCPG